MPSSKPYPSPLAIPPLRNDQHTHTIILLHGRGSNSERFGRIFLESTGIAQRLPTVKFIFPTARKRRSTVLKRTPINQWFDNYSLEDPNIRTELQGEGLEETSEFLRGVIEQEAELLSQRFETSGDGDGDGYRRIIVGGLSQGCAASVFALLGGFEDPRLGMARLGGFVGMSGWLPFEREIVGILELDNKSTGDTEDAKEDDDPFARDSDDEAKDTPVHLQALHHVRDILDLPPLQQNTDDSEDDAQSACNLQTPVFLGHGSADEKVSVNLGKRMAFVLSDGFGMDVTWKAYEGFGHWYKIPDEIDDVVEFLREKVGVPSAGLVG